MTVSPHQNSFHLPWVALIKHGKHFETLVSHPLSLSHASHRSFTHPVSFLPHLCLSPQAQNRRNRRFGFHGHVPPQSKQKCCQKFFQPEKRLKTCYFESFIQRVLKMAIFKTSWLLHAGAQADLPKPSVVPCITEQSRVDTWIQNSPPRTDSPPDYVEPGAEPTHS